MGNPNPWRQFRTHHPRVLLRITRLPRGISARTNGIVVEIDDRLNQVERRCAIAHELEHLRRGIGFGGCTPAEEASIDRAVARILISTVALLEVAAWSTSVSEMADGLAVTEDVLTVRLDDLDEAETDLLLAATTHHREPEQQQWDRYFNDEMGIA